MPRVDLQGLVAEQTPAERGVQPVKRKALRELGGLVGRTHGLQADHPAVGATVFEQFTVAGEQIPLFDHGCRQQPPIARALTGQAGVVAGGAQPAAQPYQHPITEEFWIFGRSARGRPERRL